jgi:hypothetical protein
MTLLIILSVILVFVILVYTNREKYTIGHLNTNVVQVAPGTSMSQLFVPINNMLILKI